MRANAALSDRAQYEYSKTGDAIGDIIADTVASEDFQAGLSVALGWAVEMRLNLQVDVSRATGEDVGDIDHLDTVIRELKAMQARPRPAHVPIEKVMDAIIGLVHELRNETATTG